MSISDCCLLKDKVITLISYQGFEIKFEKENQLQLVHIKENNGIKSKLGQLIMVVSY